MTTIINGSSPSITFSDGSAQTSATRPFLNRIINGAMVIDQRNAGASVTASTTGATVYTLDRWAYAAPSASKFTIQQNAGSVTPPVGFTNYLGVTSLATTSVTINDYYNIQQSIEGFNTSDLGFGTANAKTVTLSFWVRSSLTGTFGGALQNGDANRSYPFSFAINSANTWEQKSITIAGDTSGTWATNNTAGMRLYFGLGVGSTYSGTAGSWQAGNILSSTGATSVVGTNGATFYITGVQLEVGSTATSFDYRPYGTELALCQRYFYKHASGNSTDNLIGSMWNYTSSFALTYIKFPTNMRSQPSVVATSGTDYFGFYRNGTGDFINSLTYNTASVSGAELYNSSEISGTAGQMGGLVGNSASMYLGFSAEL